MDQHSYPQKRPRTIPPPAPIGAGISLRLEVFECGMINAVSTAFVQSANPRGVNETILKPLGFKWVQK